jgi:hypothetical protein
VLQQLAKKHKLKERGREKPCMNHENPKEVLRTNSTTTKNKFVLGQLCIQLQLFMQLAGFTANLPNAILSLCYQHIMVTLLRDPEGGPHRVLLEFTFEFTKQYLDIKDMYVSLPS